MRRRTRAWLRPWPSVAAELGDSGRVLLRPSGTEEMVRVMVEAASAEVASGYAERLADVVRERLALEI